MQADILIIGGSFAGVTSAIVAAKVYPDRKVVLIEQQGKLGYIPANYYNMLLKKPARHFTTEAVLERLGVYLLLNEQVGSLEAAERTVHLSSGQMIRYDRLILAMGSTDGSRMIKGADGPRVLLTKTEAKANQAAAQVKAANHIVVIGGGLIGLEAINTYLKLGKQLTLVESLDQVAFKEFDPPMTRWIQAKLMASEVELLLDTTVTELIDNRVITVQPTDASVQIHTTHGKVVEVDLVHLAVNFRPATALVEGQVTLNFDGTIQVDSHYQTTDPAIYAVGDLVKTGVHNTTGTHYLPQIQQAIHSARVAAFNLYPTDSTQQIPTQGFVRTIGTQLWDYYLVSVGLTAAQAELYHEVTVVDLPGEAAAAYLITERGTGRLLGGQFRSCDVQLLSHGDLLAQAIQAGWSDQQLANYSPLYMGGQANPHQAFYDTILSAYLKRMDKEAGHVH